MVNVENFKMPVSIVGKIKLLKKCNANLEYQIKELNIKNEILINEYKALESTRYFKARRFCGRLKRLFDRKMKKI